MRANQSISSSRRRPMSRPGIQHSAMRVNEILYGGQGRLAFFRARLLLADANALQPLNDDDTQSPQI